MTKRLTKRLTKREKQDALAERDARKARQAAGLAAYAALAATCAELGWPQHFQNDLTVHAFAELTSDDAPSAFGAQIRDAGVDLYAPGAVQAYEWLDVRYERDGRFFVYEPDPALGDRPTTLQAVTRDELLKWLAYRLDVKALGDARDAANWRWNEKRAAFERSYGRDGLAQAAMLGAERDYRHAENMLAVAQTARAKWCAELDDTEDA